MLASEPLGVLAVFSAKQVKFFFPGEHNYHVLPVFLTLNGAITDSLSLKALSHIIIDVTHRDAKKRSILDIPETRDQLFRDVLGNESVRKAIASGKVTLVLF